MMKHLAISLTALTLIVGCASKQAAPKAMQVVTKEEGVQLTKSGQAVESDAVQPADAAWSIACKQFGGQNHVESAKLTKQHMAQLTGMKGFYVVHEDAVSTLYYGFYAHYSPREKPDMADAAKAEGARAQADMKRLQSFQDEVGQKLFPMAFFSPLEPVDPPAPPEWDLRNVDRGKSESDPSRAFWSLEIGVYKDDADRKKIAVEAVRQLREQGVKDAYFYHGKTSSSVCIGAWPRDAVKEQESGGRGYAETDDASQDIIVFNQRFAQGVSDKIHDASGKSLKPFAPRLDVADPTMLEAMRRYPNRAVNGYNIKHTYKKKSGGTVDMIDPSLVILIPREETILDARQRQLPEDPILGIPQQVDQGGTLRSLGQ
jgi:hypothetical protein